MMKTTADIEWTKYVGIPYVDLGSDFVGCDCYGLVSLILKMEWGLDCPEYCPDVPVRERGPFIQEVAEECFIPMPLSSMVVGTIILFQVAGNPIHIGMLAAIDRLGRPLRFIHCLSGCNSVVERFTGIWQNRTLGSYMHKDMYSTCMI